MSIDWNKWAAIGQIAGAIGTFLAVLTSLFLARESARPKLAISAGIRLIIEPGSEKPFPKIISIDVRNVGMRDVYIDQIGWRVGRWPLQRPKWLERNFAVQTFGTVPESQNPPFPLAQGRRAASMLQLEQTKKNVVDRGEGWILFAKKWPMLGLRQAPIFVTVHLSSGETFASRIEKSLERELFEAEASKFKDI